jgi:hypothetical protein
VYEAGPLLVKIKYLQNYSGFDCFNASRYFHGSNDPSKHVTVGMRQNTTGLFLWGWTQGDLAGGN